MINKFGKLLLLIAVVVLMGSSASLILAEDKDRPKEKIAMVNKAVITRTDLNREIEGVKQQALRRGQTINESQILQIRINLLEKLIDQELLFQESVKKNIKVDDAVVKDRWEKIKAQFPNEDELNKALDRMKATESEIKAQIKKGLAISQFVNNGITSKIDISEKDARAYYNGNPKAFTKPEEIRASHILIKVDSGADETRKKESRKKIEDVQQKIKKGQDFAKLAKKFSEGPSKTRGGDLGYFTRGKMVPPFDKAAFALKAGEVSGVVTTRFGYHLIKVIDKKPQGNISFENVKLKLMNFMKQKETQKQVATYVAKLKETAKIERLLK